MRCLYSLRLFRERKGLIVMDIYVPSEQNAAKFVFSNQKLKRGTRTVRVYKKDGITWVDRRENSGSWIAEEKSRGTKSLPANVINAMGADSTWANEVEVTVGPLTGVVRAEGKNVYLEIQCQAGHMSAKTLASHLAFLGYHVNVDGNNVNTAPKQYCNLIHQIVDIHTRLIEMNDRID